VAKRCSLEQKLRQLLRYIWRW